MFTRLCFSLFFLISMSAHAKFKYIEISSGTSIPIEKQCSGVAEKLELNDGLITITSESGATYSLALDELLESPELIIGHSALSSTCTLAVIYAKNDVNESYSLFVRSPKSKKFVPSRISTITNPDFLEGGILSNYRDGALLHNDTLCFSEKLDDYYICERREEFNESLEKLEKCDEHTCSNTHIVHIESQQPAIGIVTNEKTFFFDRVGKEEFLQSKIYLIKGDKVSLHDYFQARNALYYKVTFSGKKTTTGWVRSETIGIGR